MKLAKVLVVVACVSACSKKPNGGSAGSAAPLVKEPAATEKWSATVVIGANFKDLVISFTKTGDKWGAAMEGVTKDPLPLADVTYTADSIAFTLQKPGQPEASWEHFKLDRKAGVAKGNDSIGATALPMRMVLLGPGEAPHTAYARPQTPKPPFPYEEREVTVDAPDGGKLAGTLTIPKTTPAPAVLLWSGSGQQDRDETIFGHKPYAILADRLTRDGFVVLRLDDRGTGKTTGALGTLDTEIADAGAAVEFLKKQKEVDPKKLGLFGHSTGGMVVPNVAVSHPVAFIVSLAGVAIPGRDLVLLQQQIAAKAAGATVPPEQVEIQKKIGEAALKGPDEVKKVLVEAVGPQLEKALGHKPSQAEIDQTIAKPLAEATNPWTLSYFKIDPREAWKKLQVPTLLVVGDLDSQVPADPTIAALEGAHGKKVVLTTKKLPGLNHLFQHAKTGMTDEYLEIDESFDLATLDTISTWLAETVKSLH